MDRFNSNQQMHSSYQYSQNYNNMDPSYKNSTQQNTTTSTTRDNNKSTTMLLPTISPMEKSQRYIESSGGNIVDSQHMYYQQSTNNTNNRYNNVAAAPSSPLIKRPLQIPVTHNKHSIGYYDESTTTVQQQQQQQTPPPQQTHYQFETSSTENHQNSTNECHGEEKHVIIKKKTIRRKKANESNLNILRDSFIENISSTANQKIQLSDTESEASPPTPEPEVIKQTSKPPQLVEEQPIQKSYKPVPPQQNRPTLDKIDSTYKSRPPPLDHAPKPDPNWTYKDNSTTITRQKTAPEISSNQETFYQEKNLTPASTYSAHKENMRNQQMANQSLRSERRTNETTEEIETITLQPIGKGVQDLASSRPVSRATTPRFHETNTTKSQSFFRDDSSRRGNTLYSTMPSAHRLNKVQSARNINQMSNYDTMDYRRPQYRQQTMSRSSTRGATAGGSGGGVVTMEQQSHLLGAAPAPIISESWHTRTESHTTNNNKATTQQHSNAMATNSSSMAAVSSFDTDYISLQQVISCEDQWYRPMMERDEAIMLLRDRIAGSFIVRNSSTFVGSYSLVVKSNELPANNVVTSGDLQSDLIRHFLLDPVVDENGQQGYKLRANKDEPIYSSLAHFIHAHCHAAIGLPVKLVLPIQHQQQQVVMATAGSSGMNGQLASYEYETRQHEKFGAESSSQQAARSTTMAASNQGAYQQQSATTHRAGGGQLTAYHRSVSTPGVNFIDSNHHNPFHQSLGLTAVYLGKIDVDRMFGEQAVQYAIDKIHSKRQFKTTTVELQLDSTTGITIIDKLQKLFYSRQFPAQHVLFAGFDPKQRELDVSIFKTSGIIHGRLIGIVVKKQKFIMRENAVHIFCEVDSNNDLENVVRFVAENYIRKF